MNARKIDAKMYSLFAVISALLIYLFSRSTSIRFPDYYMYDSSVYQFIAKCWLQGRLPYVGAWDLKGPLVYLMDAIGYWIYPRTGIMFVQWICLSITIIFLYKAARVCFMERKALIIVAISLVYLALVFDEGAMPEEWNLPFLSLALYRFVLFLHAHENNQEWAEKENLISGFLYGIAVGASVLIRTTNSFFVIGYILITFLVLILKKKYVSAKYFVLLVFAGTGTMIFPFVIYFYSKGCLYEAVWSVIIFGYQYIQVNTKWKELLHKQGYIGVIKYISLYFSPMIIWILRYLIMDKEGKRSYANASAFVLSILGLCFFLNLRTYPHYYMIITPHITFLAIVFLKSLDEQFEQKCSYYLYAGLKTLACVYLVCGAIITIQNDTWFLVKMSSYRNQCNQVRKFVKGIPSEERDSFMMWGGNRCSQILDNNLFPKGRFFTGTAIMPAIGAKYYNEWFELCDKERPIWILYDTAVKDSNVEKILKNDYKLIKKFGTECWYRIKNDRN